MKHKLMQAMAQRDERYLLQGRVEIDDAYLGGEANKTAFVAAVQTSADGRPLYMRLTPVADFTNEHMRQWASRHLTAGCHVVSDGTRAFAQVRLSCVGSIPCWATSRPAWRGPITRLTTPGMHSATWLSFAGDSTAALICRPCCLGC